MVISADINQIKKILQENKLYEVYSLIWADLNVLEPKYEKGLAPCVSGGFGDIINDMVMDSPSKLTKKFTKIEKQVALMATDITELFELLRISIGKCLYVLKNKTQLTFLSDEDSFFWLDYLNCYSIFYNIVERLEEITRLCFFDEIDIKSEQLLPIIEKLGIDTKNIQEIFVNKIKTVNKKRGELTHKLTSHRAIHSRNIYHELQNKKATTTTAPINFDYEAMMKNVKLQNEKEINEVKKLVDELKNMYIDLIEFANEILKLSWAQYCKIKK